MAGLPKTSATAMTPIKDLERRAISPRHVRPDGPLTVPRSYGVYELPSSATGTRKFRLGNYPVRMWELEKEFGSCKLSHLFRDRDDALQMAEALNKEHPVSSRIRRLPSQP